jgi:predicted CXXCH cytochrome family protein
VSTAEYVGSERCASCHNKEGAAWRLSQHAHALQPATPAAVLGRFDGEVFTKDGVETRFISREHQRLFLTPGPTGEAAEFPVKFTLGIEPLQQYLVELPGGRLQAFNLAWDSRPAADGGQRWFDLYPGQKLVPGDALHWTGIQQTANFMCVDCHVTNFSKGFDPVSNGYHSTWSEAGIGCEACHGPGGAHSADPRLKLPAQFSARSMAIWGSDPETRPQVPPSTELQVCGRCHARRSQLTDVFHAGQPLADAFRVSLLEPGAYQVDGQMRDEVFNYGSFLQSRMFAKGVSCSDCHDPHSQKLRADGNSVCEQCHNPARYETRAHHFHDPASKAGQCVSCHMPTVTYMVVDPRHDHSFRVPRPDLTVSLGVPNACANCHSDKTAEWLANEMRARLGRPASGFQTFAEAFAAADKGAPGSADLLARIANDNAQPAIVRASAVARSFSHWDAVGIEMKRALADPDPLVRAAAAEGLAQDDPTPLIPDLAPLLHDPMRLVRTTVARALAGPAEVHLSQIDRPAFRAALDEYVAIQRYNADRGESHMNLALLEIRRGNGLLADDHLARAIAVDPTFVSAYVQLADLLRARHEEDQAAAVLRRAVERNPDSAQAHHALGLSLVRQRKIGAALEELHRAVELDPESARYAYVYAVALDQSGNKDAATKMVHGLLARHPYDVDALSAASIWAVRTGNRDEALRHLRVLQTLRPNDLELSKEIERVTRGLRH